MFKQVIIFTDAYGNLICNKESDPRPDPYFECVHHYTNRGWLVKQMEGTGVASQFSSRGSFCFVLEKIEGTKKKD